MITLAIYAAEQNRASKPYPGYQEERKATLTALQKDLAILKAAHGDDTPPVSAIDSLASIPEAYNLQEL